MPIPECLFLAAALLLRPPSSLSLSLSVSLSLCLSLSLCVCVCVRPSVSPASGLPPADERRNRSREEREEREEREGRLENQKSKKEEVQGMNEGEVVMIRIRRVD